MQHSCDNCGIIAKNKCSQCMVMYYCNRSCQKSAWSQHKYVCKQFASLHENKNECTDNENVPHVALEVVCQFRDIIQTHFNQANNWKDVARIVRDGDLMQVITTPTNASTFMTLLIVKIISDRKPSFHVTLQTTETSLSVWCGQMNQVFIDKEPRILADAKVNNGMVEYAVESRDVWTEVDWISGDVTGRKVKFDAYGLSHIF